MKGVICRAAAIYTSQWKQRFKENGTRAIKPAGAQQSKITLKP